MNKNSAKIQKEKEQVIDLYMLLNIERNATRDEIV